MKRSVFESDHRAVRELASAFVAKEIVPHHEAWEAQGRIDRELFRKAGEAGLIGMALPEEFGGGGNPDFRYNAVLIEEVARQGVFASGLGLTLHNDLCLPYFLSYANEEQRARWMPGLASGDLIGAIAMTEPGGGSDLAAVRTSARRDGDHYVVNGSKTFISNGMNSNLLLLVTRTDPDSRHQGMTLIVVEADTPGFERTLLDKVGMRSSDTAELSFVDARIPVANRLGEEGDGWLQLMHNLPQERLSLAIGAVASACAVFDETVRYVSEREAFGAPLATRESIRLLLAELKTELDVAQTFVDRCLAEHVAGELDAVTAAEAKWWCTELQTRVIDRCLQLHGGYGYMREYRVARAFMDSRAQTIYGGTTEVMKQIIAKSLPFSPAPGGQGTDTNNRRTS